MPHTTNGLSQAQTNRIRSLANNNYTTAEIAKKLGVSTSTVTKVLNGN